MIDNTVLLFAHPENISYLVKIEEVERQRDLLQVRNAELILLLHRIHGWMEGEPIYRMGDSCIAPHGWDVIRKDIEAAIGKEMLPK